MSGPYDSGEHLWGAGRLAGGLVSRHDAFVLLVLLAALVVVIGLHAWVLLRSGREPLGPPGPAEWIVRFVHWRRRRKAATQQ